MKNLNKLKSENLKSFILADASILVQKYNSVTMDDIMYEAELKETGDISLKIKSGGIKEVEKQMELSGFEIDVESRPKDPNRIKSITANYLRWVEDPRVEQMNHRVAIKIEKDLRIEQYV